MLPSGTMLRTTALHPALRRAASAAPLVAARAPFLGGVRTYRVPSLEELAKRQDEYEARVDECKKDIVKLGYLEQGIARHEVIWGEHDQFRHVNNVHYLRWFESARMEWVSLMAQELSPELRNNIVEGRNVGMILAQTTCRYRRPVTFPDTVLIGQAVLPITMPDRFTLKYAAYSVAQREVVALSEQLTVTYDYTHHRKANIPEELRQALEAWQYTGK